MVSRAQRFFGVIAALLAAISVGCGGGGSGGDTPQPQADVGEATDWVQGQFLPQETFYARCAA
ncbi:MAG: hypothetical protein PVF63_00715, partial [Gammaproteobacteria bacterium]